MSMELDALPFPQGIFMFPPVHCHSKVPGGRHSHAYLGTPEGLFLGHSRILTWATTCQHQSNRTFVTARGGWHARFGAPSCHGCLPLQARQNQMLLPSIRLNATCLHGQTQYQLKNELHGLLTNFPLQTQPHKAAPREEQRQRVWQQRIRNSQKAPV